jgi:hypothetical protein
MFPHYGSFPKCNNPLSHTTPSAKLIDPRISVSHHKHKSDSIRICHLLFPRRQGHTKFTVRSRKLPKGMDRFTVLALSHPSRN